MVELVSETFEGHVGEQFEVVPGNGERFAATLSRCDLTIVGDPADWIERVRSWTSVDERARNRLSSA